MFLPDIRLVPRLHHYYDKYVNIKRNLLFLHSTSSSLGTAIKRNQRYLRYIRDLDNITTETDNYLNNLQENVRRMINETLSANRFKQIYKLLLKVCSAKKRRNLHLYGRPAEIEQDPTKTQNYLEIDDYRFGTGKDRYCQNLDEKNKPSQQTHWPYDWETLHPHHYRDRGEQHCLKDSQPWTGNQLRSYTDNCRDKIHEQYAWATKEMCMIISRCPKSVIDDRVPVQYDRKIDHILHNINRGNTVAYNWTNASPPPHYFDPGRATRIFLRLGDRSEAVVYSGKFSDYENENDPVKPFKTLYKGSDFDIFDQSDEVTTQHFLSTSTNVDNTVNVFVKDN